MIQRGLYYGPPDKDRYCAYRYFSVRAGREPQPRPDLRCPGHIDFYVKVPDGRGDDWRKAWAACAGHLTAVIWQMQQAYGGSGDYLLRVFAPEGGEDEPFSPDDPAPVPVGVPGVRG